MSAGLESNFFLINADLSLGEREAIRGFREELQLHLGCRGHSWFGFIIHKMGVIGPTTRPCGVAWPVTALEPRPCRGGQARYPHSPAFCQILPAPAITCPLRPAGSQSFPLPLWAALQTQAARPRGGSGHSLSLPRRDCLDASLLTDRKASR